MQDLRVIGVEDGKLLAISDDGQRFRIEIDDGLRSSIRNAGNEPRPEQKVSPKEIQALIRAGMSAEEVAASTGVRIEDVRRFEGPIVAEREYVVNSAMDVPVHTVLGAELGEQPASFGEAINARLRQLGAANQRWASWKETQDGWVIKLTFVAGEIEHDARWRFDPKKLALSPLNSDAENLSRQGDLSGTLIPRLRAVDGGDSQFDQSRFDSGAFTEEQLHESDSSNADSSLLDTAPQLERVPYGRIGTRPAPASTEQLSNSSQTADLLEALRKRRGEREAANF
ncbi:MAG: DUF3071 domain-containing protein, partial [Microbacteriaceae bacterium]|nr:DUF3071 domain-containing protein [Microbacteriaceae bacterium]